MLLIFFCRVRDRFEYEKGEFWDEFEYCYKFFEGNVVLTLPFLFCRFQVRSMVSFVMSRYETFSIFFLKESLY